MKVIESELLVSELHLRVAEVKLLGPELHLTKLSCTNSQTLFS